MATLLLAEAGAEVIKIERPAGEEMRGYEPRWGRDSINFALLNRGKKSIAVDLKSSAACERILQLAGTADVVVEQFRPGVMNRLGLGYEAFRSANIGIIYCTITASGAGRRHRRRRLSGGHEHHVRIAPARCDGGRRLPGCCDDRQFVPVHVLGARQRPCRERLARQRR
jgi:hypothetical protein